MKNYFLMVLSLSLAAVTSAQTIVSGPITENTTWTPGNSPYILESGITVNTGVVLTLQAGTIVKLGLGQTLQVSGVIQALGADGQPVVFTSTLDDEYGGDSNNDGSATSPSVGYWRTVAVSNSGNTSIIDHCIFRYAGWSFGVQSGRSALSILDSDPIVTNSVFEKNDIGISMNGNSAPIIRNNTFVENNGTPIRIGLAAYPSVFENNSFVNNQYHAVGIASENYSGFYSLSPPVLSGLENAPYVPTDGFTIAENGSLTIHAGTIFKMLAASGIVAYGTLNLLGTEQEPVVFTSILDDSYGGDTNNDGTNSQPEPGSWERIQLLEAASSNSTIDHCVFRYAGWSFGAQLGRAAIKMLNSSPAITHSTFEKNDFALSLEGTSAPEISGNTFSENLGTALRMGLAAHPSSFSNNTFENNQFHGIVVKNETYNGNYQLSPPSLEGLENSSYIILEGLDIANGGTLTISEGTVFKFPFNSLYWMRSYGTLHASGSIDEPIVFTSLEDDQFGGDTNNNGDTTSPTAGYWRKVELIGSGADASIFSNCLFRYGGQRSHFSLELNGTQPTISNCTFSDNNGAIALLNASGLHLQIDSSSFCNNYRSINIKSGSATIQHCSFSNPLYTDQVYYHIENESPDSVTASNNWWPFQVYEDIKNNPGANLENIVDRLDNPAYGPVVVQEPNVPNVDFEFDVIGTTVLFNRLVPNNSDLSWDFGDGTVTSQANPSHTYTEFGSFQVCLGSENCDPSVKGSLCKDVIITGVNDLFPDRSGNQTAYIGYFEGAGFTPQDVIRLIKAGEAPIEADTFIVINEFLVKVFFTFNGESLGFWDLEVNGPLVSDTLSQAIRLEENQGYDLIPFVDGAFRVLQNRPHKLKLSVRNAGNEPAFGVPIYFSIDGNLSVSVTNEIVSDSIDQSILDATPNNLLMYYHPDGDSSLVGAHLALVILPGETVYLELEIIGSEIFDGNLDFSVGEPWFTIDDLIGNGIYYRSWSQVPPCVECAFSAASFIPGPIGAAANFYGLLITTAQAAGDNNLTKQELFNIGVQFVSVGTSFGGPALQDAALGLFADAINTYATGSTISSALNSCTSCANQRSLTFPYLVRNSFDPNEKIGLKGHSDQNYFQGITELPYTIFFENADTATAPASEVFIFDQIDTTVLDLSTLTFTGFGFGDTLVEFLLPIRDTLFIRDVAWGPNAEQTVRVSGKVEPASGRVSWSLRTLDSKTMDLVDDFLLGFLPPNITSPEGEGFVRFVIDTKPDLPHLTSIENTADIIFDYNDPIITPTWVNTIDLVPPQSAVLPLDTVYADTSFLLKWAGTDADAGIAYYDIFYAKNGGGFKPFLLGARLEQDTFTGEFGNSYAFYSIAYDHAGNVESFDGIDAVISLVPPLRPTICLQGAYDPNTGLMRDQLRAANLLPLTEPYTDLGYAHTGGGGETATQEVFNVTGPDAVVDWVVVELRDKSDFSSVLATRSALLQRDGDVVDTDGVSPLLFPTLPADDYYVAVRHRNHLGVMTASPVALFRSATTVDFTSDLNNIYGGSNGIAQAGGGLLCLFSGDFNGNGQVQNTDYAAMVLTLGTAGYAPGDFDLNGEVQNTDLQLRLTPNIGRGQAF